MAGAGFKTFASGEVLTAANVNTYLMQQTVMVFADSSARSTALGANVSEGMLSYLKDTNQVEVYNGSSWVASDDPNAIQNTIVDAKGDLISATAADTPARLASSGVNGQVLTIDTSTATGLKWAAPASAGSFTQLATGTLSGSTLSLTSISGAYKNLRLAVYNVRGSIDGVILRGQLNGDTGTNYASTSFNSSDAANTSWPVTYQTYSSNIDDTSNPGMFIIDFFDYANTTSWKIGQSLAINEGDTTAGSYSTRRATNWYKSTSAITQIDIFLSSSATFTAGTYTLWGIN